MDYIAIIQIIVSIIIAGLLAYAWLYAIPEQRTLFEQCEEKILCQKKMLTGKVCDKYIEPDYWNPSIIGNISE